MLVDERLADIFEPGRRPKRALVLVDHGGADPLEEVMAAERPAGGPVFAHEAFFEAARGASASQQARA